MILMKRQCLILVFYYHPKEICDEPTYTVFCRQKFFKTKKL